MINSQNVDLQQARWIAPTTESSTDPPAAYFQVNFEIKSNPSNARLIFAAIGVLEPWINGSRVSEDWLTPGWSDFRKRSYISQYDVTAHLQEGLNSLGLILGNGWGGLPYGPPVFARQLGPSRRFIALLEWRTKAGHTETLTSNSQWQWRTGAIRTQSLYNGETYDARKELKYWSLPNAPLRGWQSSMEVSAPNVQLEAKKCPPVRVTEEVTSVNKSWDGKGWMLDFGQNLVGVVRMKLKGTVSGQKITLQFGEMLKPDGDLYIENLRDAKATDVYICQGGKSESYTPRFTFHGFRFAYLQCPKDSLLEATALVLHNDLERIGSFTCSSSLINRLQSAITWGQRGNFLEAPTDCPQRDERLGWSGDAQVFVSTACFNYDCESFYRQWMDSMRDGQREDGAFPDTAPDILGGHGNAGWGDAGIIVPYTVWLHYGETAIIKENWEAMERYMAFLESRSEGYIQPETVYGDWLAVDAPKPEWGPTPKDLIGTAYFAHDARLISKMAAALGKKQIANYYAKLRQKIEQAFLNRFVTSDGLVLGDTQTCYLMALGFDLLPEMHTFAATQRLIKLLENRDWHLSTGFLGTPLLNPVLSKVNRSDLAHRLLFQRTYPSWLYPLENGATTMWERWNSWTKESGFGPVDMNSFNHYAYGAIGEWLYQVVGGISPHPDYPGYKRAILTATPGPKLKRAKTAIKTRNGRFVSEWSMTNDTFNWKIIIPKSATAELILPWNLEGKKVDLNGRSFNGSSNLPILKAGEYHLVSS